MRVLSEMAQSVTDGTRRCAAWTQTRLWSLARSKKGQGTTEYAILVGVLVVIAIIAIIAFRPKIEELWTAISDNVNKL